MSKTEKFLGLGVLIAIVIAAVALLGVGSKASLGAVLPTDLDSTNFTQLTASGGLAVGSSQQFQVSSTGELLSTAGMTVGNLVQGGGCFATSTAASGAVAGTLTASQLASYNCFEVTINAQAGMALTLPASSTMTSILSSTGQAKEWIIENATTTAATTLTITKGVGIDLIAVTANDDVIDGTEYSRLSCWKKTNTDVACIVSELLAAD